MNGMLRVTAKIRCKICGCQLRRTKSIQVIATEQAATKVEAQQYVQIWQKSLQGSMCKTCKSIVASV